MPPERYHGPAGDERRCALSLALKSVLAWIVLLAIMIGNGMVRVGVLQPRLGEDAARQLASLLAIVIVFAAAWIFVRIILRTASRRELITVGLLWLALTIAFEFSFGRLVVGASWETLLADYNVLNGRLWLFVLLSTLVAPLLCGIARERTTRTGA